MMAVMGASLEDVQGIERLALLLQQRVRVEKAG
jgi:hypothetical protein